MWRSMLSPGGRGADCLGVARGAVAIVGQAGATPQVEAFDGAQGLPPAVRRGWGTGVRAHRSARIVVGNDLACHWLLAPPRGATSLRELQAVAKARFAELFAERPDEWRVTGDWRCGHPFICTAVPSWVVAGVHAAPPDAMPAAWSGTVLGRALELFHRQLPNTGWCCIQSPCSLALMHLQDGLPVTLRVLPVVESAARDGIFATGAQALQREAARDALSPAVQATWLDLTAERPTKAITPHCEHAGVAFRVLRLDHGHRITGSTVGAAGEATVAALLGTGSGVRIS